MRVYVLYVILGLLLSAAITEMALLSPSARKKHELFTKLGLTRVRAPNSHHRKRLAVESRHHTRTDDSQMFIIKLPPNPHYYSHVGANDVGTIPNKSVPVSFKNNGKPAKVYHWNLPIIKKLISSKQKSRTNDRIGVQNLDSWNEVLEKAEKERKPMKPKYYVPKRSKKATFTKYFPGNGKVNSFYVIESSKKAHYHRLSP